MVVIIPFILLGISGAIGLIGAYKGIDAISNYKQAIDLVNKAKQMYDEASRNLEKARVATAESLEMLGRTKIKIWGTTLKEFVRVTGQIKNVELNGSAFVDDYSRIVITQDELKELRDAAYAVAKNAGTSVGKSTAVSYGAYGIAASAAKTVGLSIGTTAAGTAFTSLHGAAATSALLAWFGGGSLAAGGLGMAGGAIILGGIAFGPAILFGGFLFQAKSKKELANAESLYDQTLEAVEKMNTVTSLLYSIKSVSDEYNNIINRFSSKMTVLNGRLEMAIRATRVRERMSKREAIKTKGGIFLIPTLIFFDIKAKISSWVRADKIVDYTFMTEDEKYLLHTNYQAAQIIKKLLETPLLNENGDLTMQCRLVLNEGDGFLTKRLTD